MNQRLCPGLGPVDGPHHRGTFWALGYHFCAGLEPVTLGFSWERKLRLHIRQWLSLGGQISVDSVFSILNVCSCHLGVGGTSWGFNHECATAINQRFTDTSWNIIFKQKLAERSIRGNSHWSSNKSFYIVASAQLCHICGESADNIKSDALSQNCIKKVLKFMITSFILYFNLPSQYVMFNVTVQV